MSARKKWRTSVGPGAFPVQHRSLVDAYRRVESLREDVRLGVVRFTSAAVHVDQGAGWELFERLDFADERPPA